MYLYNPVDSQLHSWFDPDFFWPTIRPYPVTAIQATTAIQAMVNLLNGQCFSAMTFPATAIPAILIPAILTTGLKI